VIVVEMILMGVFATIIMDLLAGFLVRKKIIFPFITPEAIGRWFFYMFRGKFVHHDIQKTPALINEKLGYFISHYSIGIVLAGIYLFLGLKMPVIHDQIWAPLLFGIVTVFLPWFWLLPSTGLGFMASKSSNRFLILRTNFINHTNFGVGLFLWIIVLHRFFLK
jgi:hypothetical protein